MARTHHWYLPMPLLSSALSFGHLPVALHHRAAWTSPCTHSLQRSRRTLGRTPWSTSQRLVVKGEMGYGKKHVRKVWACARNVLALAFLSRRAHLPPQGSVGIAWSEILSYIYTVKQTGHTSGQRLKSKLMRYAPAAFLHSLVRITAHNQSTHTHTHTKLITNWIIHQSHSSIIYTAKTQNNMMDYKLSKGLARMYNQLSIIYSSIWTKLESAQKKNQEHALQCNYKDQLGPAPKNNIQNSHCRP